MPRFTIQQKAICQVEVEANSIEEIWDNLAEILEANELQIVDYEGEYTITGNGNSITELGRGLKGLAIELPYDPCCSKCGTEVAWDDLNGDGFCFDCVNETEKN